MHMAYGNLWKAWIPFSMPKPKNEIMNHDFLVRLSTSVLSSCFLATMTLHPENLGAMVETLKSYNSWVGIYITHVS